MRRVHVEALIIVVFWVLMGVFGVAILSGIRRERSTVSVPGARGTELAASVPTSTPRLTPTHAEAGSLSTPVLVPEVASSSVGEVEESVPTPGIRVITYTVKPGDNLSRTARRYGVSVDDIVKASGIEDKNLILPGQVITIPVVSSEGVITVAVLPLAVTPVAVPRVTGTLVVGATPSPTAEGPVVYTVQVGDTLSAIALRYGTTVDAIMEANGLTDRRVIRVGQRLVVGSGSLPLTPTLSSTPTATVEPTLTP